MNANAAHLYSKLPVPIQNLAVSFHGLRLKHREYGKSFERLLEEFEGQQWFTESEMEAYQNEHLRAIVCHAYQTVPFYKRHFDEHRIQPSDIRTLADIVKIPPVGSKILMQHAAEMTSLAAGRPDRIEGNTSGTTGLSRTILYDRRVCLIKNVVDWRLKKLAGVEVGDAIAFIMGQKVVPIEQKRPPFWRKNSALNHLMFSAFHFSPAYYDAYIDALQDFGASAMDGYPSTVSMFAEAILARNRSHPLTSAFVSSEVLLPHQRRVIEQAFNCDVFDYYGMAERAVFATECEQHRGLHINSDFGHCELLDEYDRPVSPGESGRIVITGWHNYTMPLIRFKTDDWATLAIQKCPCGRVFPLLDSIDGRQEDQVATPDGRFLDVSFAYSAFDGIQHKLCESQIYQEASGRIVLRIVPQSSFAKSDADQLVAGIKRVVGSDATVDVEIRDEIPRTKAGKFRWLVSDVPRNIYS